MKRNQDSLKEAYDVIQSIIKSYEENNALPKPVLKEVRALIEKQYAEERVERIAKVVVSNRLISAKLTIQRVMDSLYAGDRATVPSPYKESTYAVYVRHSKLNNSLVHG